MIPVGIPNIEPPLFLPCIILLSNSIGYIYLLLCQYYVAIFSISLTLYYSASNSGFPLIPNISQLNFSQDSMNCIYFDSKSYFQYS